MYKLLKTSGIPFKYIGNDKEESFKIVEEQTYKGECYERFQRRSKEMKPALKIKGRSYTPDFKDPKGEWIIEVKGRKMPDFNMRWDMFKSAMNKKRKKPILFMPITKEDMLQVIKILKQKGYATK